MSNTCNNSLYTCPTRLERAYANFLLQTCFSGALPISGQDAVVFLTNSNLPRPLLREIWNIIDPHQHGALVQPQQWWTLLKLVALAQQQPQQQQQDVQELTQVLTTTLTPLPVFRNVVIPSENILLQQYSSVEDSLPEMPSSLDMSNSGAHTRNNNAESNNHAIQPQQEHDVWKAPVDFNAPKQTTSLSAALDELGGMLEDMPLPSLGTTTTTTVQQEEQVNHSEEEEDDFGDFENAPIDITAAASQDSVIPETHEKDTVEDILYQAPADFNTVSQTTSLEAALEELGPIENAPLPSLSTACTTVEVEPQVDNDDNDDDEFGDFEAPQERATSTSIGGFNRNTTPATVALSSALDELRSFHDTPLPPLDNAAPVVDESDNDEFGDFEAPQQRATSTSIEDDTTTTDAFGGFNPNATTDTVPLSSALDELGSSHDVPLPPLDNNAPVVDENDVDEFGDFEASEVHATTTSTTEDDTTATDAFSGFNPNTTPAIVPLSSALDELGSAHDMPLPPLDDEPVIKPQPADSDESDDDFGNFKTPELTLPLSDASKEDAFSGFHKQNDTPAIVPLSMALDELGPTMDTPLPSLGTDAVGESNQEVHGDDEVENDEFGNFVAPQAESIELFAKDETDAFTEFKETVSAPIVPLSSALDELGSSHDAPLPSLDTFAVVSEPKSVDEDEDDFGDFEDAPNNTNEEKIESTTTKNEDLVTDGPSPTPPSNEVKADEFDDFEAPKEATSSSSFLDSLGAIQDVPLPPLGVPIQPQYDDNEDDDDDEFGDFEAPPVGVQEAAGVPLSSVQDVLDSTDNAPFPPLNEQQQQQRDTAEVQEATLDSLSSALDSLGPTQDAPLPSLGFTESQPREECDNVDDFGDFNGVPNRTGSSDDPLTSAYAEFGPAEDKPLPSLESRAENAVPNVSDIEGDEFGSFEASPENEEETGIQEAVSEHSNCLVLSEDNAVELSQDEPLPPTDSQQLDPSSDLGNDVTEAPKEVKDISSATIDNDDPFSSAFDAIAPVENSPLPSLGLHKVAHEIAPSGGHDDSQESDFGSFEGPLDTQTVDSGDKLQVTNQDAEEPTVSEPSKFAGSTNSSDPLVSVFDTIAPVEDAPLPALVSEDIPKGDIAGHVANNEDETHQSEDDEDGFGSFEDATGTEDVVETQEPEQTEQVAPGDVFGQDTAIRVPKEHSIDEDLFSNAIEPIDEPLPTFHSASGSDFSGFETASENITSEEKKGEVEKLDGDIDDFGGFSGASSPVVSGTEETNETVPSEPMNSGHDDDDDFGDFTAIEAPVEAVSAFDAEWGDFEEPSGVTTSEDKLPNDVPTTTAAAAAATQPEFGANFATATPESDVDDEFGSFQEIEHPRSSTEKEETLEDIVIRMQEMQKSLTIQDSKGGLVDFVKMFQENRQVNKPASGWRLGFNKNAQKTIDPAESLKRAQRCCQVMMLLTTSNKSSLSHWEKIFNVVRDELAMGSFLLEEAKSIADEKAVYSALGTWVAGLGEYVRVTRLIAATLCDLLCLDIDGDVLQMKNSMALLDSAIEVEDLWTTVQVASKGLNLDLPKLETVSDIRTKCLQRFFAGNLCQLTLQPLSVEDNGTTKNPVEWNGRDFFACAANFWSNRVSTDVPAQ